MPQKLKFTSIKIGEQKRQRLNKMKVRLNYLFVAVISTCSQRRKGQLVNRRWRRWGHFRGCTAL